MKRVMENSLGIHLENASCNAGCKFLGYLLTEKIFQEIEPKEQEKSLYQQLKDKTECKDCLICNEDSTRKILEDVCSEIEQIKQKIQG